MAAEPPLSSAGSPRPTLRLRTAHRVAALQPGEPCGDAAGEWAWGAADGSQREVRLLAIVDGLGHGADAAQAAQVALASVAEHPERPLGDLLAEADRRLVALRGAAMGLLRTTGDTATHAGVGNTRCLRWRAGHALHMASQPGIVGGGLPRRIQLAEFGLAPGDWILMFTDGLDERLQLPVWLPEWDREPALLCAHLLNQCRVGRDDGGVLVAQVLGA